MAAALAGRRLVRRHRTAARGARLCADRAAPTATWGLSRRCQRRSRRLSAPGDRRQERGHPRTLHLPASKLGPRIRRPLRRIRRAPAAGRRRAAARPRILGCPNGGPAAKSAYGGPTNVHIPSAVSPFGSQLAPAPTKPKPKPARPLAGSRRRRPRRRPPRRWSRRLCRPRLPRGGEAGQNSAPPAPEPKPKTESPPGETENASKASTPAPPEAKPEPCQDRA